jgi:hypothetical protein
VAMQLPKRIAIRPTNWRGKGLLRISLFVVTAVAIAALASFFGVARDYSYLRAILLSGDPAGRYHALATSLAAREQRTCQEALIDDLVATLGALSTQRRQNNS